MASFTETERRGFLGKVIHILDNGIDMTQYKADDFGWYKDSDKQNEITKIFSRDEFVILIKKINKCQPNRFINHSLPNIGNYVKMFNYLMEWRSKYWQSKDMSGFLCGMIGNIRKNREKLIKNVLKNVLDKTNSDVLQLIIEYLGI
jgi:hypothetical protein